MSTSAASITKQSMTDLSASIPPLLETILKAGTNDKQTGAAGATEKDTSAAPNPTQKQATGIIDAESLPSLWDKAYDSLQQEKPEVLSVYEDLLSRVLIKGNLDCSESVFQQC